MAFLGPYYYGKHRWDNYLLDIQKAVESGNAAQRRGVRLQEEAVEIAQEQTEELRQQTAQLHRLEEALHSGFEALRADFEWGFTLIADRMDRQIEELAQIAAKLDEIHKTLQSPLLTQARELFQLGQQRFRKGLLDKALEAYLQAEQKNEVDFPLQLQVGKLLLYGRDEDDDVINLPEAEKHLLSAARYSAAEKGTFPKWNEYCAQAYFHAAVAAYLIGEQEQDSGRSDSMRACLERAIIYLTRAAILWPAFTEIVYTQAKCHALLGQTQEAQQKLEMLSDRDRRYFAKASQDGDFEALRDELTEIFKRATTSPGPHARATQAKLDEVAEAIKWAKRSAPVPEEDLAAINTIEAGLAAARKALPTLDVDIEDLREKLNQMRARLDEMTQRALQNNIGASERSLASAESRKRKCENATEQLKQTIKATSGSGMGCGFAVGFPLTIFLFLTVLSNFPAVSGLVSSEMMTLALLMAAPAGFVIGNNLSYRRQTAPHRRQIEENARVIEECIRSLASLRQQTEAWKQEMRLFVAWQTRQPPTVVIDHEATGGNLEADCVVVRSPIVGTYYDAPAPGAAPFVRLGDRVLPGQVLCIIESMKIKNEIEAEVGGVITAKLVEDGRGVEYGVKLFAIRPR